CHYRWPAGLHTSAGSIASGAARRTAPSRKRFGLWAGNIMAINPVRHVAFVSESSQVPFKDLSPVSAAVQKQATRDFGPLWDIAATVDAFEKLEDVPVDYW